MTIHRTSVALSALVLTGLVSGPALAGNGNGNGNGAPSGHHYTLNLIGVPKQKSAAMEGNHGHRIFVKLEGKSKIWLEEGPDFEVTDANGTDGNGARFRLPNPDPDGDGETEYSVYARALGGPGGTSTTTTCATDMDGVTTYCSMYQMVLVRDSGKRAFRNYSRELLYLYQDIDGDGTVERVPLFDQRLQGYYWDYDNNGMKLVQLRFYPVATVLSAL